ncbi:Alpha/beta hydrolase family [Gaiella occulta]|uniref:Alpha/beta hydrolase family n=1 Tax=Gaiella occulta TaxID=1002870 RepID=A0A7M2Z2E2_9ACTN|nr:alpha/beta fold hydrolase [Gaiella occulta]RDI75923.1 Alpha/beta hydrolase family [Gaiella occulta]
MRGRPVIVLAAALSARQAMRRLSHRYGRPPRRPLPGRQPPADAVDVAVRVNARTVRGWFLPSAPACVPGPAALVMHGWGSSAADMLPAATPLRDAGLRVLLLDARCHGRSDDDEFASMPRFAEDVAAGLAWLRRHPDVDCSRIVLVGHSVGAGACLLVASRDHGVAAVVSIASMAHPEVFMRRTLRRRLPAPLTRLALRYLERTIGQRFDTFAPVNTIGRVRSPVLLLHGGRDTTVPVEDAYALQARAGGRARIHVVPAADHGGSDALAEAAPALLAFLRDARVVDDSADASGLERRGQSRSSSTSR